MCRKCAWVHYLDNLTTGNAALRLHAEKHSPKKYTFNENELREMLENATRYGKTHGPIDRTKIPLPDPKNFSQQFWSEKSLPQKRFKAESDERRSARLAADWNTKALEALKKGETYFFVTIFYKCSAELLQKIFCAETSVIHSFN